MARHTRRPSILLLCDYRGHFYSSVTHPFWTMRVDRIADFLRASGCDVRTSRFSEIDIRTEEVRGHWVLYTSQEDQHLFYKNYIEDVILALELKGGILLPRFEFFRAHHDKIFMELLRDTIVPKEFRTIVTRAFGTLEEAERASGALRYPIVVKPAAGAMSAGVALAHSPEEFLRHAERISRSATWLDRLKQRVKYIIRDPESIKSIHRHGFIAQTFIPGLRGDFKVLVYGDRYFVLRRDNRENDFRASGSGKIHFDEPAPRELLETARRIVTALECPYVSLDIGFDGVTYHLLEMQFLMFGNVGLERSVRHYRPSGKKWVEVPGTADLEQCFAESVVRYIAASRRRGE